MRSFAQCYVPRTPFNLLYFNKSFLQGEAVDAQTLVTQTPQNITPLEVLITGPEMVLALARATL